MIYQSIKEMIGNTPLYQFTYKGGKIYVKLEKYNPVGSIKDRAVYKMLEAKFANREIKTGDTVVEASSGNTGIALAALGKAFGLKVIIVMMENMTVERKNIIKALGAKLVLTNKELGMQGAIDKANELITSNGYQTLDQFSNPNNPLAHEDTAKEIIADVSDLDAFVAAFGTAGTITGISTYLKKYNKNIRTIAVEPYESPLVTKNVSGKHQIAGIGANFIPHNLVKNNIDEFITITSSEALDTARWFAKETGLLVGISSGANIAVAKKIVTPNKKIVTIAPDSGERYLSGELYA